MTKSNFKSIILGCYLSCYLTFWGIGNTQNSPFYVCFQRFVTCNLRYLSLCNVWRGEGWVRKMSGRICRLFSCDIYIFEVTGNIYYIYRR